MSISSVASFRMYFVFDRHLHAILSRLSLRNTLLRLPICSMLNACVFSIASMLLWDGEDVVNEAGYWPYSIPTLYVSIVDEATAELVKIFCIGSDIILVFVENLRTFVHPLSMLLAPRDQFCRRYLHVSQLWASVRIGLRRDEIILYGAWHSDAIWWSCIEHQ